MKIIRDNIIYVQLEDINYIVNRNIGCPKKIIKETLSQGYIAIDYDNMYDFVFFKDKEIIDFINKTSFILDYDELNMKSIKELNVMINNYLEEKKSLLDKFNSMTKYEKKEDTLNNINDLEYKFYQVNKILLCKKGNDHLVLPEGIETPKKNIFKKIFKNKKKM